MCYFERTLNIHPPFVVSVAVLIINIHRSRAMKQNDILNSIFYTKNTNEDEIFEV